MLSAKKRHSHGFTIVELIVILIVIGILATIGIASYGAYTKRTAEKEAEADLGQAAMQLEKYKANNGGYPAAEDEVNGGEGLPRSDSERMYHYQSAADSYCISTEAKRSGKILRIEKGSSKVLEGECPAPVAPTTPTPPTTATAPIFVSAFDDGIGGGAEWSIPGGESGVEDVRASIHCHGSLSGTLYRSGGATISTSSMWNFNNQWNANYGCEFREMTIHIAYRRGGAWSPNLVITPGMIDEY